jgi:MFS family permease
MSEQMLEQKPEDIQGDTRWWWSGLSARHWAVLLIAWMGWVFDIMDMYILVLAKDVAMKELLGPDATPDMIPRYSGWALGLTLVGWSLGGLIFGTVADRWGRTRTMALTILIYSIFTGLVGISQNWWQLFLFRFIAALGIGGEWGTGASMIAEVFPRRSRSAAAGILQAASGVGILSAILLWSAVGGNWRYAFFAGALPALLALLVRLGLSEPEAWVAAKQKASTAREKLGSVTALFKDPVLRHRTIFATLLALIGIFGYWATNFWVKESLTQLLKATVTDPEQIPGMLSRGLLMMNLGNLFGFLIYIPITNRFGRKPAFYIFHVGSAIFMPVAYWCSTTYSTWVMLFFVAGAFTSGIYTGYTIYFPELYPTRVRATGASFCYNVGRVVAAPGPILMGILLGYVGKASIAGAIMGTIYILGLFVIPFLPETKGVRLDSET